MQCWKIAAIALAALTQSVPAFANQAATSKPATGRSCLKALGALGTATDPSLIIADGTKMNSASDLRSLRKKARDGLPIIIKGGDFAGKKFGDDDFSNLCFDGTNFTGTRWSKSRADGVAFINANLTGAIFDRVSLRGVLFRNSILKQMDASGANISYGQLDGGWDPSIAGLRLENAQLTGFRFQCGTTATDGCSFDRKQISLRGANLTGASLAGFSLWDANLVDVVLNNTEVALDQIAQYANADVQGPLLVSAAGKQVSLAPEAFRLAIAAFGASETPDTECANPATPLTQIFCQTGQAALRSYRDDVDRLYQSMKTKSRPDGTMITVVAPSKEQDRYLASLRKCALKDEEKSIICISDKMAKRRAMLVALSTKNSPLESDARALFVNVQTPMVQAVSRDPRLASLTPLLVGASPTFLLAYRDDDSLLNARGISMATDGTPCVYGFSSVSDTTSRKKKIVGSTFTLWRSGGEFAVEPLRRGKRKVKKARTGKKRAIPQQANAAVAQLDASPTRAGCASTLKSGPLIRVPLSEGDFDFLWAAYRPSS